MYLSPTPINRVITKIENIRSDSFHRTYHCAGIDDLSYYEFALDFFKDQPNKNLIRKGYVMTKKIFKIKYILVLNRES